MIPNGISPRRDEGQLSFVCRCSQWLSLELDWCDLQSHSDGSVKRPEQLEGEMSVPPSVSTLNVDLLDRIQGSMLGMALGDALGAHVEFRPREYLLANPVSELEGGGTWSLQIGQVGLFLSLSLSLRMACF